MNPNSEESFVIPELDNFNFQPLHEDDSISNFMMFQSHEPELVSPFLFQHFTESSETETSFSLEESIRESVSDTKKLIDLSGMNDQELQEHIEKYFNEHSNSTPLNDAKPMLYFVKGPPKRVYAPSPSKLEKSCRPGGSFTLTIRLVIRCIDGSFIPFKCEEECVFTAAIYGKPRNRNTQEETNNKIEEKQHELVPLILNPIGKPLLVSDDKTRVSVEFVLKKGESIIKFSHITITCGSNAARSKNASIAARDWHWDYYLRVDSERNIYPPLVSGHITTDSNRSQTREKRKRDPNMSVTPFAKRGFFGNFSNPYPTVYPSTIMVPNFMSNVPFQPYVPVQNVEVSTQPLQLSVHNPITNTFPHLSNSLSYKAKAM